MILIIQNIGNNFKDTMKKTLIIDGGLGRNVAAIPALEEFVKRNPDSYIITSYWTGIFWGNKLLTDRIFDASTKGLFDKIKDTKIIKPEPYYNTDFINNKISIAEAFNREINGEDVTIKKPKLYFSKSELYNAKARIDPSKKTIVYQPYGSTAKYIAGEVVDETLRSLNKKNSLELMQCLIDKGFQVIVFDTKGVEELNGCENLNTVQYRECAAVIANADYFLGVDSCGQHIAYAMDVPGATFFGGTSEINFGYPDWFTTIVKDTNRKYVPFRLCDFDTWMINVYNDGIMEFDDMKEICHGVLLDIENKIYGENK